MHKPALFFFFFFGQILRSLFASFYTSSVLFLFSSQIKTAIFTDNMLQYFHLQGVENENIFVSWSKILGLSFKFSYRAFKFDQAAAAVIGLLGATIVELTSRCRKLDRCSKTLSYDMQSVVMATSRSRLY